MKEKKTFNLLLNLAKTIFDDEDYNIIVNYLNERSFNNLRLFVENKLERLKAKLILYKNDSVLEAQIERCEEMDTLATNLYIDNLAVTVDN